MAKISHIKDTDNVIWDVGCTRIIKGVLKKPSENRFDNYVCIPMDTVFEEGYNYIIEVSVDRGSSDVVTWYHNETRKYRLVSNGGYSIPDGSQNYTEQMYQFVCELSTPWDMENNVESSSYVIFRTEDGEPSSTLTINSVVYWRSEQLINHTPSAIYCPFPIGGIYISTSSTNPGATWPGTTWTAFATGRTLIGNGTATDSNSTSKTFTGGSTGGEFTHKLVNNELPKISGSFGLHGQENGTIIYDKSGYATGTKMTNKYKTITSTNTGAHSQVNPGFAFGNDGYHNNIQPYIVVYMWKRTN